MEGNNVVELGLGWGDVESVGLDEPALGDSGFGDSGTYVPTPPRDAGGELDVSVGDPRIEGAGCAVPVGTVLADDDDGVAGARLGVGAGDVLPLGDGEGGGNTGSGLVGRLGKSDGLGPTASEPDDKDGGDSHDGETAGQRSSPFGVAGCCDGSVVSRPVESR